MMGKNQKTSTERFFALLKEKGLTQTQCATILGYTSAHISRIVNGKEPFSLKFCKRVSQEFGIRMEWLLGEDDFKTDADFAAAQATEAKRKLECERNALPFILVLLDLAGIQVQRDENNEDIFSVTMNGKNGKVNSAFLLDLWEEIKGTTLVKVMRKLERDARIAQDLDERRRYLEAQMQELEDLRKRLEQGVACNG